ncbi:response regulator [Paenibacillus turicensis]|uniref:response regulator transcription factor n=1 Tax=Paenibacillus turicensis TaxID=160487 RepID=UPI003D2CD458
MIDILLVDDETYVTESLEVTIPWAELGITSVYRAASAKEALHIVENNDIDIVVTDIRMPGMSGLELIDEINQRWAHIRCILLTGHSDFEYTKKAIQLKAIDYILKPVNDEEFMTALSSAIGIIRTQWDEFDQYHRLLYSRKSDYKILRENVMHDLLLGREMTVKALAEQLEAYEIEIDPHQSMMMLLIRLSGRPASLDQQSLDLMDFAVGNIAEEVFGTAYHVWFGRGPHECLVMFLQERSMGQQFRHKIGEQSMSQPMTQIMTQSMNATIPSNVNENMKTQIELFQMHVQRFLQGVMSIVVSSSFTFSELPQVYWRSLGSLVLSGPEDHAIIFMDQKRDKWAEQSASQVLDELYKPPMLTQLLETRQWEAAESKLNFVFDALEQVPLSRNHMYELYLYVTNAFMYIAHKQGSLIHEMDPTGFDFLFANQLIQAPSKLKTWATEMLSKLQAELSDQVGIQNRRHIIAQVQELVTASHGQALSVKAIADQVYMHPVYLSKIYKAETGEGLGDYMIRMRMERALYLLKHTNKKIYEITSELGYQNPQYFSKMFKKHYGMTPNEFRD